MQALREHILVYVYFSFNTFDYAFAEGKILKLLKLMCVSVYQFRDSFLGEFLLITLRFKVRRYSKAYLQNSSGAEVQSSVSYRMEFATYLEQGLKHKPKIYNT